MNSKQEIIKNIIDLAGAPIISRKEASKLSGGLVSEKTLANLDCLNEGPKERVRIGSRIGYPVTAFAEWYANRVKTDA